MDSWTLGALVFGGGIAGMGLIAMLLWVLDRLLEDPLKALNKRHKKKAETTLPPYMRGPF